MDGIDLGFARKPDDVCNVEVGLNRTFALAHKITLIGLEPMQRKPVLIGINGNRPDTEFSGGAKHADRDFTAICDEYTFDLSVHHFVPNSNLWSLANTLHFPI